MRSASAWGLLLAVALGAASCATTGATGGETTAAPIVASDTGAVERPVARPNDTRAVTQTRQSLGVGLCHESVHAPFPEYGATAHLDRPATLTSILTPEWPEVSGGGSTGGTVIIAALVCEHGNVVQTRVVRSIPLLDEAAVGSILGSDFEPATLAGKPVSSWIEVPVSYKLREIDHPRDAPTPHDVGP